MNLPIPKKYIGLSIIIVSLLLVNVTLAQTMPAPLDLSTTSEPMQTDEPIILVESTSTPSNLPQATPRGRANVTNEQRVTLNEIRQTRIMNLAANISNRMDAAVIRLSNISQRLEQRILKMEESGIETSLAKEKLSLANETLAAARLKLSDIDTLVKEATYSTETRNDWQTVRERYRETGTLIRQAHQSLSESIMTLKNPTLKTQVAATSSTEISPITE